MANNNSPKIPLEYTPISMWGYFGYSILFSIPFIGWIFLVIFALTASNINLRNFARSQFCVFIIWAIFIMIALFSGLIASMFEAIKL